MPEDPDKAVKNLQKKPGLDMSKPKTMKKKVIKKEPETQKKIERGEATKER